MPGELREITILLQRWWAGTTPTAHVGRLFNFALSPKNSKVVRRAALSSVTLGGHGDGLRLLPSMPPELIVFLARHPDMADFSRDTRFKEMTIAKGGQ